MNWAHIHLLLNHVPVLGTIFGLALLGYGVLQGSEALKRAALGVFVAVALLALPVYFTGEPAEEVVESAAGVSKAAIDAHEAFALISLMGVEVLGVISLAGLVLAWRGRPVASEVTGAALVVSVAVAALMAKTANLGGQIHHEEIRAGTPPSAAPERGEDP